MTTSKNQIESDGGPTPDRKVCGCKVIFPWSYTRDRPEIDFCDLHKDPYDVVALLHAHADILKHIK